MKRMFWILAGVAVTVWQVAAGIQRCGAVDGGVLIVPLALTTWCLVRGVARDLQGVFRGTSHEEGASW